MKWNVILGTLVLGFGLCTQSYGFELLDRMLGVGGCGCDNPCAQKNGCAQKDNGCAQKDPGCTQKGDPKGCAQKGCGIRPLFGRRCCDSKGDPKGGCAQKGDCCQKGGCGGGLLSRFGGGCCQKGDAKGGCAQKDGCAQKGGGCTQK